MTPVFAYLRVSGQSQLHGDGFPRQLTAIQSYIKRHDMRLTKIFRESGVSGTVEGMDRPQWSEMITSILANGVKTIIIECLNRLARDLMIQEHIIADLRRHEITLISVAEPDLCIDDPSRKLLRQIMGAVAEYDKSMLVAKLRAARKRIRATGKCDGRKKYGERCADDPKRHEAEQVLIKRMQALRASGLSFEQIAERMNKTGSVTRMGRPWRPYTIDRILQANPLPSVKKDAVAAFISLGSSRKDAESAVQRAYRDGDTLDMLIRRASAQR